MFSNRGIAQCLPEVLNAMGYSADIIDYSSTVRENAAAEEGIRLGRAIATVGVGGGSDGELSCQAISATG